MTYAIKDTDWTAPKYLLDGVRWLAADEVLAPDPALALAIEAVAADAAEAGAPGNA